MTVQSPMKTWLKWFAVGCGIALVMGVLAVAGLYVCLNAAVQYQRASIRNSLE